jgi:hypothetical protein
VTTAAPAESTSRVPMTPAERLASNPALKLYWDGMIARRLTVDDAELGVSDIAVNYVAVNDRDAGVGRG